MLLSSGLSGLGAVSGRACMQLLVKEHTYWMTSPKLVKVASGDTTYSLSRFHAVWNLPRPESFRSASNTLTSLVHHAPILSCPSLHS